MFKKFWGAWKRVGQAIGDFLARIVLTVFYFTILVPFAVISRIFTDPLNIKETPSRFWNKRETYDRSMEDARRLY